MRNSIHKIRQRGLNGQKENKKSSWIKERLRINGKGGAFCG